jgi:hypothetical protein
MAMALAKPCPHNIWIASDRYMQILRLFNHFQTDKTHNLITEGLLTKLLKMYSNAVQKSREQVVQSTYKQLRMEIYEDCSKITINTFINKLLHKTPVEDDLTSFVEDIKMATY